MYTVCIALEIGFPNPIKREIERMNERIYSNTLFVAPNAKSQTNQLR